MGADLGINGYFPKYDVIGRYRGVGGSRVLGNFLFKRGGAQAKKKTYPRPVYRLGGGRHFSKPQSLNIGADLGNNGEPEYDVVKRYRGMEEGLRGVGAEEMTYS